MSPYTDVRLKTSTQGVNIPVLDGIRGLAVLIVLSSHTNAFCMYAQGSIGVLLFFFLSGFVLIIPFYEEPNSILKKKSFLTFFLNRAFRIIPAYTLIAGATAIIQHTGYEWFLWNISFLKGWNHFWSVAAEVRFYLLFPVAVGCMALFKNRYTQISTIAIITYVSYQFKNKHHIDMMDGRHVPFYFYMFSGGMLTYLLVHLPLLQKYLHNTFAQKLFTTLSFLIICSFVLSSNEFIAELWRPLFHNLPKNISLNGWRIPHIWLFTFMIFFFSLTFYQTGTAKKILECYFLRHIGLLSFSIYLSHMVVMFKLNNLGFRQEGLFIAVFVVSYLISLVSYILIEKPFLQLKKMLQRKKKVIAQVHIERNGSL